MASLTNQTDEEVNVEFPEEKPNPPAPQAARAPENPSSPNQGQSSPVIVPVAGSPGTTYHVSFSPLCGYSVPGQACVSPPPHRPDGPNNQNSWTMSPNFGAQPYYPHSSTPNFAPLTPVWISSDQGIPHQRTENGAWICQSPFQNSAPITPAHIPLYGFSPAVRSGSVPNSPFQPAQVPARTTSGLAPLGAPAVSELPAGNRNLTLQPRPNSMSGRGGGRRGPHVRRGSKDQVARAPGPRGVRPRRRRGSTRGPAQRPRAPRSAISDMVGRCCTVAQSQSGSRFIQQKLSDPEYFPIIFSELKTEVAKLIMSKFGHYAIETLFSRCDDDHLLELVEALAPHISTVACHQSGSFSLQTVMRSLRTPEQVAAAAEGLRLRARHVAFDRAGHHVLICFLTLFDHPQTRFIHDMLADHPYEFATSKYGRRVLTAAIGSDALNAWAAERDTSDSHPIASELVAHAAELVDHQNGNYVIQYLLEPVKGHGPGHSSGPRLPRELTDSIKEKLQGMFAALAVGKASSNVVEACLRHSAKEDTAQDCSTMFELDDEEAAPSWTARITRELLEAAGDLVGDRYGNYCLQTALREAQAAHDAELLSDFTDAVRPHLDSLRRNVRKKWANALGIDIPEEFDEEDRHNAVDLPNDQETCHAPQGLATENEEQAEAETTWAEEKNVSASQQEVASKMKMVSLMSHGDEE